jgi:UDP-N-acetylmuramate-alanine ligase
MYLVDRLEELVRPGDLLLTLGAGDIVRIGEEFLARGARG